MTPTELWNLRAKARDMQAEVYDLEGQIEAEAYGLESITGPDHYMRLAADYRQMARDCRKTALELAE